MAALTPMHQFYLNWVDRPIDNSNESYCEYVLALVKNNRWLTEPNALDFLADQKGFHVRGCGRSSLISLLTLRKALSRLNASQEGQAKNLEINVDVQDHHPFSPDSRGDMYAYAYRQMSTLFRFLPEFEEARVAGIEIWQPGRHNISFGYRVKRSRQPDAKQAPRFTKFFDF